MGEKRGEHEKKTDSRVAINGPGNSNKMPDQSKHLLLTKFYIPSVRPNQITRPRLDDLLNGGLEKTLILVSAPAGYGKSTLVSRWLKETGIPSAWLSLDAGDNDPARFLRYLLTAMQPVAPGIGGNLPDMFQGAQPAQVENVINLLTNELAAHRGPVCSCAG